MSQLLDSPIRNAARAVIVRDECILLLRKFDETKGERYALPGGAQELGETLQQALDRECREEIGSEVVIRDLLHVADYFKPRSTTPPTSRHVVEFLFACDVPAAYQARSGHRPDKHQVAVIWSPLDTLAELPLAPRSVVPYLVGSGGAGVYLGTID